MGHGRHRSFHPLFTESMKEVYSEKRYGIALLSENHMETLDVLFQTHMNNKELFDTLLQLRDDDSYSYQHSFDVFVLGTLYGMYIGMEDLEVFSESCLYHDLGKIDVDTSILKKPGKLTSDEFKAIQEHTIFGEKRIKEQVGTCMASRLARSHHERLNGSGYPDGIHVHPYEQRHTAIIAILDVYSALTLKRTYRQPLPSFEALEELAGNPTLYDEGLVKGFMEMLHIYPVQSIVGLSNGEEGKVMYIKENAPFLPLIESNGETFELPVNRSLFIASYQGRAGRKKYVNSDKDRFIEALIEGDRGRAEFELDRLADNKRVEEVYIDLIGGALREIGDLWETGRISVAEEHVASVAASEILHTKQKTYVRNGSSKEGVILTTTLGDEKHLMPLQLFGEVLRANGWDVVNVSYPLPYEILADYVEKMNISYIGISCTMKENIPVIEEAVAYIKEKVPNVSVIAGGAGVAGTHISSADATTQTAREGLDVLSSWVRNR
ncbi:cobalamin B12-binding domain-containing protein (plasmid) [Pontibacillus sp. ALD_SL1]|uniref:B12-binding domain-containing protein n=1 Tax=Pontibacillus sp. ALD_SL1 TaxID=2777185 RepID=UPI001A9777AA|nr:B12-binding domain-containing protein [Pontibacillus sp. ALD_SL1]QST02388.1 cobalamin B12-binding domain-containing protein [Pontibacillus sp. ALD_SL1]